VLIYILCREGMSPRGEKKIVEPVASEVKEEVWWENG
jgi:hypothetical protein